MTRDSLFARSTFLPALAAAKVGINPADPTIAAITISTSSWLLTDARASVPTKTSVDT